MKHSIKIHGGTKAWTYLNDSVAITKVVEIVQEKIGPVTMRNSTGFIRYEGPGWRIVRFVGGDWYLQADDPAALLWVQLML